MTKRIERIKKLQALLNKDHSEYTQDDKDLVRSVIEKHIGDEWATEGWETNEDSE